jgi:hypothetical protein
VNSIRTARNTSAAAVAAIAAWSSYSHMVHVALHYGERAEVAYTLPFSVDGMLVVASVAMVDDRRGGRQVRPVARVAFTAGVIASIAANIGAAQPTVGARIVAAWPALALLLVVEILARPGKPPAQQPVGHPAELTPQQRPLPPTERTAEPSAQPPALPSAQAHVREDLAEVPSAASQVAMRPVTPRQPDQPPQATHRRQHADRANRLPAEPIGHRPVAVAAHRADADMAQHPSERPAATGTEVPEHGSGSRRRRRMPPEQPTDVITAAAAHGEHGGSRRRGARRRPAAVTRELATQIMVSQPHLSRGEVAAQLGVSTRRLREVLAVRP